MNQYYFVSFVSFDGFSTLLQVLDLSSVQLVYSSSYFKSLSTGGNVSKALVRILPLIVLKVSFICTGRPTVHTNLSRKHSFISMVIPTVHTSP